MIKTPALPDENLGIPGRLGSRPYGCQGHSEEAWLIPAVLPYAARCLVGLGLGLHFPTSPTFLAEARPDSPLPFQLENL